MTEEVDDRGAPLIDVIGPDGPAKMSYPNARDCVTHSQGWSFKDHDRAHALHRAWTLSLADRNVTRAGAEQGS